jgi:APA family basic amino acid/polyamine antiporter
MKGVVTVAEKASTSLFGTTAAGLISAMILVSILGALNGAIFVGPRVYYAMARDGLFFKKVGQVHPRFKTPAFSILLQAIWASLLALTGTFEQLFTFAMFAGILFWVLAAAAIFTLRKKRPDLPRPYKAWGYPVVPFIFIVALSGILLNTLIRRPVESLTGLGLMAVGIPLYYLWKRKRESNPDGR